MHKFFYSYLHAGSNGYFEILIFEKKNFLGGFFKIYTDTRGVNKVIFIFPYAASKAA
jgi:hypothetical protein